MGGLYEEVNVWMVGWTEMLRELLLGWKGKWWWEGLEVRLRGSMNVENLLDFN